MHDFTKKARGKGWTLKLLADRWGISYDWIRQIARDPEKKHWDMLNGTPRRPDDKRSP